MTNETTKFEENTTTFLKYPALFYMGLEELIQAKSVELMELRKLELKLIEAKHDFVFEESKILLTTDFKELGLTNEKMRQSYITDKLFDKKYDINVKKYEIECKKDTLEIIDHLIKLNECKITGE